MIVLDTNVVSELLKSQPDVIVERWFLGLGASDVALTCVTAFELRYGIEIMVDSSKRRRLAALVETILSSGVMGPVLNLGSSEAQRAAVIRASRRASGLPVAIPDCLIAGIVWEQGAILATRNTRDFKGAGIALIDPWRADSP